MAWSAQQKVFSAILTLAAAGLVVDRVWLSDPVSGPAPAAASQDFAIPHASQAAPAPAAGPVASGDLAARLESLRSNDTSPDPFKPAIKPSEAPVAAATPEPPRFDTTAFVAAHRLTGIMRAADGSIAVIGGRMYHLGDSLDGLVLSRIEGQMALFEGENVEVRLTVGTTATK